MVLVVLLMYSTHQYTAANLTSSIFNLLKSLLTAKQQRQQKVFPKTNQVLYQFIFKQDKEVNELKSCILLGANHKLSNATHLTNQVDKTETVFQRGLYLIFKQNKICSFGSNFILSLKQWFPTFLTRPPFTNCSLSSKVVHMYTQPPG